MDFPNYNEAYAQGEHDGLRGADRQSTALAYRKGYDAAFAFYLRETQGTVRVYQQPTSFKIHRRKGCGVSSRTRYGHSEIEMTEVELAEASDRKCQKCWKVSDGGAKPITPTEA
jgi:hypothetical protein